MLTFIAYSVLGLGLLERLSTASPLNVRDEPILNPLEGQFLRLRQDNFDGGPWPPELPSWSFPANKSNVANTEAKPGDAPPGATTQSEDGEVHARKEISKAFIDKSCSADQKNKVLEAWEEARTLAHAQTSFDLGYNYDIPHTQWLGKDWNSESSWIPWRKDFRKRNQENFGRLKALFSNNAPKHDYLYFYCGAQGKECDGGVQASTTSYTGTFWSNHYITFCAPWFNQPTLAKRVNDYRNQVHEQKVMENFQISSGGILFHEIWHLNKLVSNPQTGDYAYQAQPTWDLAKNRGTWWSTENADSYHLDAIAIHIQQTYKSPRSPVPFRELKNIDAQAFSAVQAPPNESFTTKFSLWDNPDPPPEADKIPDTSKWDEITYNIWTETPRDRLPPPLLPPPPKGPTVPLPPAPPAGPTKSLSIATDFLTTLKSLKDLEAFNKLHWLFLATDFGKSVDCRSDPVFTLDMDIDRTKVATWYPNGEYGMQLFGEDCKYQNPGNGAGKLVCGKKEIQCLDDPADQNPSDPKAQKGNHPCGDMTRQPVFVCNW